MNKKAFYHAILAAGYITLVVSFMQWITGLSQKPDDNVFMPITILALLVLSVAIMAYLFFYQPVLLLLDGKRPEAAKLFLTTIAIFAVIVVVFFVVAMFIIP
jgi:hypothetical protein